MIFNHRNISSPPVRDRGFSLLELMIALAIAGIASAFAIPSYQEYAIRGKLPEAHMNLVAKRIQLEQWFQDNRTYVGAPACGLDAASSQYFDFSCAAVAAATFTLQAAGKGSMAGFTFTINQANAKSTVAVPSGWSLPSTNCWVAKKGGAC
jgi:type IV pilus assembly protein PilE